jgi:hypothetical protein
MNSLLNNGIRVMIKRFLLAAAAAMYLVQGLAGSAAAEVILRVDVTGDGSDIRELSDADLSALPQISFTTSTIWTTEPATYSGPSLAAVLDSLGAKGASLNMIAVNDYKVDMPWALIEQDTPIIANRINGQPFSIRDKGPLWVVFPYDSDPRFQTEEIYSFSIWQMNQIRVVPE